MLHKLTSKAAHDVIEDDIGAKTFSHESHFVHQTDDDDEGGLVFGWSAFYLTEKVLVNVNQFDKHSNTAK